MIKRGLMKIHLKQEAILSFTHTNKYTVSQGHPVGDVGNDKAMPLHAKHMVACMVCDTAIGRTAPIPRRDNCDKPHHSSSA